MMLGKPKGVSVTTKTVTMSPSGEEGGIMDLIKQLMSGAMDAPVKKRIAGLKEMKPTKIKGGDEESEDTEIGEDC